MPVVARLSTLHVGLWVGHHQAGALGRCDGKHGVRVDGGQPHNVLVGHVQPLLVGRVLRHCMDAVAHIHYVLLQNI